MKKIKINDVINIKGIKKTNPNHEGRVIKINDCGVFINNINMPFNGTFSNKFIPFEKIIK